MGESPDQLLLTESELTEMSALFQSSEHRVFTIVRDLLIQETWIERPHLAAVLMYPLMRLCARYLYHEKKRGYAVNAVGKLRFLKQNIFGYSNSNMHAIATLIALG